MVVLPQPLSPTRLTVSPLFIVKSTPSTARTLPTIFLKNQDIFKGSQVLTPDRIKRLEALPGWDWDFHAAFWTTMFSHLEDYVAKNGNTLISARRTIKNSDGEDIKLGAWVNTQRNNYKNKKLIKLILKKKSL